MSLNRYKTIALGLAAFLGACSTSVATPAAPVAGTPSPALWKLADEDTTIYLFGTIHLLPKGTDWRTPLLDKALTEADVLAVEVLLPDNPAEAAQVMMKLGTSPGLPPLSERVPAEKREALDALVASSGIPAPVFDRMETWAAAITLASISLVQMGFDPNLGVENRLKADYGAANKPVIGLETAEEQFGFFDGLSEEAQRAFLVGTLDDPAKVRAQFEAMLRSWLSGDVDDIAETFNSEETLTAELREVLLRKRNEAWAEWVAERLEQPGTVLLAVGAGHLAGTDSVQQLLEAKGLRTTRLQ